MAGILKCDQVQSDSNLSFQIAGANVAFMNATSLTFYTNGSERARIDTSGNVAIGTASPTAKLHVSTGVAGNLAIFTDGINTDFHIKTSSLLTTIGPNAGSTSLAFQTGGTERARIESSGNLLVGTTSQNPGYGNTNTGQQLGGSSVSTFSRAATDYVMVCNQNTVDGSSYYQMNFRVANVQKGSIISTSSATAYNTSSDYRLKNTIAPMTGALAKVALLKPCTYKWNIDGSSSQGFIAHELAEIVPDCVSGEKDAVDADGNIKPQGIDTSFLVATLTAAIQEQQALITQLQADVAALKAGA